MISPEFYYICVLTYDKMNQKEIKVTFEEYGSIEELNAEDRELAAEAITAMQGSYAP